MSLDKPWNDVAEQLRPAQPDLDPPDDERLDNDLVAEPVTEPIEVIEADPADVADQRRVVPLPDDRLDEQLWPGPQARCGNVQFPATIVVIRSEHPHRSAQHGHPRRGPGYA